MFWNWLQEKHPVIYEVFWDVVLGMAVAAFIASFWN